MNIKPTSSLDQNLYVQDVEATAPAQELQQPVKKPAAKHHASHHKHHHEPHAHAHIRRFARLMAARARRRIRQNSGDEDPHTHNELEQLLLMLDENKQDREHRQLRVNAKFDTDHDSSGQSGQSGQPHSRNASHDLSKKALFGKEIAANPAASAQKEIDDIVSNIIASISSPGNDASAAAPLDAACIANALISLRNSKAQHDVDTPINHAVLKIVREFLALDSTPANLPATLAGIRDQLVSLTPTAVSKEALRNFHLKLPIMLLNLRRPRTNTQRIAARSSISALLARGTT